MILTGKIKDIQPSVKPGWFTVVLGKTRKGKPIEIPVFFGEKFRESVSTQVLYVGLTIDVTCFVYGKKKGDWWNTYIVAENWRKYLPGQKRTAEVVNKKTGEIREVKGRF